MDIMCIQEHKRYKEYANNIGKFVQPSVQVQISKVDKGHSFELQQKQISKGGTYILMDPKWAQFVSNYWR